MRIKREHIQRVMCCAKFNVNLQYFLLVSAVFHTVYEDNLFHCLMLDEELSRRMQCSLATKPFLLLSP